MLAQGDEFQAIAALTRPRAERALGVPVELVTSFSDITEAKLQQLEGATDDEHVMLLDADLVFFGWDWHAILPGHFNAAPDMLHPSWPGTKAIIDKMPFPKEPTLNTGLWIAPGSLQPVFAHALILARNDLRDFQYRLWDQTPLNVALQQARSPRHYLPAVQFNWQLSPKVQRDPAPAKHTYVVHLIEGTPQEKLKRVSEYCERFPYP